MQLDLVPRPGAKLAVTSHCEVKVAAMMRDLGIHQATLVIDRQVCGTRSYDRGSPTSCDALLPDFLQEGAKLTVIERDAHGWREPRTYIGTKDPT